MNEVAMLIHIPVVGGAKGNAKYNDAAWFDSMSGYRYMWLLYRLKKEQTWEGHPLNQGPQQIIVLADVKQLF